MANDKKVQNKVPDKKKEVKKNNKPRIRMNRNKKDTDGSVRDTLEIDLTQDRRFNWIQAPSEDSRKPFVAPCGVTPLPCWQMTHRNTNSTLVNHMMSLSRSTSLRATYQPDVGAFVYASTIERSEGSGRPGPAQTIASTIQKEVPAGSVLPRIEIKLQGVRRRTKIDEAKLLVFGATSGPQYKVIGTQLMNGIQAPQISRSTCENLVGTFQDNQWRCTNSAIYAKLLFLAAMRQSYAEHGIRPVFEAFNPETNKYFHINVNDPASFNTSNLFDIQGAGIIVFTGGWGYSRNYVALYRLLGHAGTYWNSPTGEPIIPASAYVLPEIACCSIGPDVMNPAPAMDFSPYQLREFALDLARFRDEAQDWAEGYAMACQLIGADAMAFSNSIERDMFTGNVHPNVRDIVSGDIDLSTSEQQQDDVHLTDDEDTRKI